MIVEDNIFVLRGSHVYHRGPTALPKKDRVSKGSWCHMEHSSKYFLNVPDSSGVSWPFRVVVSDTGDDLPPGYFQFLLISRPMPAKVQLPMLKKLEKYRYIEHNYGLSFQYPMDRLWINGKGGPMTPMGIRHQLYRTLVPADNKDFWVALYKVTEDYVLQGNGPDLNAQAGHPDLQTGDQAHA